MRAAVFSGPNQVEVREVPTPKAGNGELVVRVRACAICGTDLRIITGRKTRGVRAPSILGHEISGEVAEVGTGAENFAVGDRVAIANVIPCGRCYPCQNGMENACENRQALGYEFDGGFAEYVRIPAAALESGNIFKIPENLSFEEASLAEPLGCVLNGQEKLDLRPGATVVVIGAGPIGLMHVKLAKLAGARRVIVSEPLDNRRAMALASGADQVVDPRAEDLVSTVRRSTGGLGADACVLAIGVPALVNVGLSLLRRGGVLDLFAGFEGQGESTIQANLIHYNELTVRGATACSRSQYQRALGFIASGQVDVQGLISHRFSLDDFSSAVAAAASGSGMKVVVAP